MHHTKQKLSSLFHSICLKQHWETKVAIQRLEQVPMALQDKVHWKRMQPTAQKGVGYSAITEKVSLFRELSLV